MTLTIRTSHDPGRIVTPTIAAIRSLDPMVAATDIRSLETVVVDPAIALRAE